MEELVKKKQPKLILAQLLKYAALSIFTYLVYSGLSTLALIVGLDEIAAIVFGFVGATSFNFFLARIIFLSDHLGSKSNSRVPIKFILAVLFNLLLVLAFNSFISRSFFSGLASVLTAPLVPAVINFFVLKYLVFRVK